MYVCIYICGSVSVGHVYVCMYVVVCVPMCVSDTCIMHGPFQPMRTNSQVKTFLPQRNSSRKPETHEVSLPNYQPKVFRSHTHTPSFVGQEEATTREVGKGERRGGKKTERPRRTHRLR